MAQAKALAKGVKAGKDGATLQYAALVAKGKDGRSEKQDFLCTVVKVHLRIDMKASSLQ
jgi:hypothetical protein